MPAPFALGALLGGKPSSKPMLVSTRYTSACGFGLQRHALKPRASSRSTTRAALDSSTTSGLSATMASTFGSRPPPTTGKLVQRGFQASWNSGPPPPICRMLPTTQTVSVSEGSRLTMRWGCCALAMHTPSFVFQGIGRYTCTGHPLRGPPPPVQVAPTQITARRLRRNTAFISVATASLLPSK